MSTQVLIVLALQVSILATVFGFGLQATLTDALHLWRHPALFLRSLLAMFLVMPIVAIVIVDLFPLSRPTEIVLIALSISPIPPLLPRKESKAGGHGAYALGMMMTMALLAIAIVPLGAYLLGKYFDRPFTTSSAAIARTVLMMVIAPLAAGMAVRAWKPAIAARLLKPVTQAATLLLVAATLVVVVAVLPTMLRLIGDGTLRALLAFITIGLAAGHWLGGPASEDRTVLALSTASRHPAIALAIAKGSFPSEPYLAATIVLYLLIVTLVALPYVFWRRRSAAGGRSAK